MSGAGFYEQKSIRPGGLALVIAMHAGAFAALVLVKTTVDRVIDPPIEVITIRAPQPEPDTPPPPPRDPPRQQPSVLDATVPIVDRPITGPVVRDPPAPYFPPAPIGERVELAGDPVLPPLPPVRVEAQLDPRYARDLQPPYPPSEEARQREGMVRVLVTIGADGRVKAVERISATNDAFWRSTERHALTRWRFRPATLGGRAVESTKTMNVTFRIEA